MEYVQSEAARAKALSEKGDLQGSADIANKLVAQGLELPPELLTAEPESSPQAAQSLSCKLCSKGISGQYSSIGSLTLCLDCGNDVRSKMQQAQELAARGDEAGALRIAEKLAEQGLEELLGSPGAAPQCSMCKKSCTGKYGKMGEAIVCESCGDAVNAQMQQVVELVNKGDIAGAAKIAKLLTDQGFRIPQEIMQALSQAPLERPSCFVCSKVIQGKCAQMGDGYICFSCGQSVNEDIMTAQELVMKGDTAGAAVIARSLKARGVPLPDELTEAGPIKPKSSMPQRTSGAIEPSSASPKGMSNASGRSLPSSPLAKAGAIMLGAEPVSAGSQQLGEPLAQAPESLVKPGAVEELLAELAPAAAGVVNENGARKLEKGSGPAYTLACNRAEDLIKKGDMQGVQQIAGGLIAQGIEVPEFMQGVLDAWESSGSAMAPSSTEEDGAKASPSTGGRIGSRGQSATAAGSGSSAAKSLAAKREPKAAAAVRSRGVASSPQAGKARAESPGRGNSGRSSPTPAKARAVSPQPAKARAGSPQPAKDTSASPQPKAAAKSKAASAAAGNSTLPRARPMADSGEPALSEDLDKTEAPEGTLGIHRAAAKNFVPFTVLSEVTDDADGPFASADVFSSEESGMLQKMQAWNCRARLHDDDWEIQVRGICAPSGTSAKTALFLHGLGDDRCFAYWSKFWFALHSEGYHVLTFDMPGHGRSSSRRLPARDAEDAELLLAVIAAFTDASPGQVSCFADAGGASTFIRAYTARPTFFSGHHVLTNPIVAQIPPKLRAMFERHGNDLLCFFADGWGKTDVPFSIGSCGQMLGFAGGWMERIRLLTLIPPEPGPMVTPGVKAMKDANYLFGNKVRVAMVSRESSFYCLFPSEECLQDVVVYLESPRLPPVVERGPAAPAMTALEMGEVNESFRVFVRIRPMLRREETAGSGSCVQVQDIADFPRDPPPQRIKIESTGGEGGIFGDRGQRAEFVFDRVFMPGSQLEVFDQVAKPLVEALLQGTNVTMFAYGQTGTGKTYTMEGPRGDEGLIQNAVRTLFDGLDGTKTVYFQYIQLYNTDFKDLLQPESNGPFAVEEGKKFMKVRGAKIMAATSPGQLLDEVAKGAQYRASGKTNMNDASSRSHAVLAIMLTPLGSEPDEGTVMYMVDLAGSERVKRSGVQVGSSAFSEATSINTALSALGRVVVSLVAEDGKRAAHIPYKDNELTFLLKSGIGGRSKTALIACITAAEDSLDESLNTLRFSLQASHVKNRVADKEAKDKLLAAAGAIEDSAHELVLSADGTGEVPLPGGPLPVRGSWSGDRPVVICIHDFGKDASQFDGLISELKDTVRILAPSLDITTEKEPDSPVAQVLALVDWLGIPKPTFVGRDYGAILCVAFKIANPSRAGALVLENHHQKIDSAQFKAKMKAQPDYVMKQYTDCWLLLSSDMKFGIASSAEKMNVKALKGKVSLLWPSHFKGNHDKSMANQHMAKSIAKELRTSVTDSYFFSDADVAQQVIKSLPKET